MVDCSQLQISLKKLFKLRNQFAEAYSRVDESLGRHNPENMQAIGSSETKMREIKEAMKELESLLHISLKQAQEIMDTEEEQNFMGPEQVKKAFGIELKPEQIPQIPFSQEELERARELGQFLVLRVSQVPDKKDKSKQEPLTMKMINEILSPVFIKKNQRKVLFNTDWYKNEDFYTKETPQAGWALISKGVILHSHNELGIDEKRNYVIQTEKLIEYLKNEVFQNMDIPEIYEQAIKEFKTVRKQEKLDELITQDWQKAAQILENLQITQLLRQSPVEILYDLMIYFQNTGQRLLKNNYTWSSRRSSVGRLVNVGDFGADGLSVRRYRPGNFFVNLGVCLSRRS